MPCAWIAHFRLDRVGGCQQGPPCRLVAHTRHVLGLQLIRRTPARMNSESLGSLRSVKARLLINLGFLTAPSKRLTTMHAVLIDVILASRVEGPVLVRSSNAQLSSSNLEFSFAPTYQIKFFVRLLSCDSTLDLFVEPFSGFRLVAYTYIYRLKLDIYVEKESVRQLVAISTS